MRIIQFKENQKEVWNKFITENNSESFLQSWEWGNFNCVLGRKIWRIGIVDNNLTDENKSENTKYQIPNTKYNLSAVALIIKYNLPFRKSYLYCPRGPVVNKSGAMNYKSKIFDILFNEIKKIAKKEKAIFLRIDPPVDQNLKLEIRNLEKKGFEKSPNEIQPRDTLMLDLEKSEDELLKEMKQKTRYNIRLAKKKELRITNYELRIDNKKVFKEKFEKFWELVKETSRRDKFASHNKNYYWKMLENLGETQNFAGAGLPAYSVSRQPVPNVSYASKKENGISKQKELVANQFPYLQAKLYLAKYNNKIIVANIVLYFGDLAVYLHGASSNEHRNVMAPYLLQWQQIQDAKKAGCKKYDFWGISSKLNTWGGITRFKKGFGGYEKNYIGAYDLAFDKIGYTIFKLAKYIKSKKLL